MGLTIERGISLHTESERMDKNMQTAYSNSVLGFRVWGFYPNKENQMEQKNVKLDGN